MLEQFFPEFTQKLDEIDAIYKEKTVSYTHLDVYKRQLYVYAALFSFNLAAFKGGVIFFGH